MPAAGLSNRADDGRRTLGARGRPSARLRPTRRGSGHLREKRSEAGAAEQVRQVRRRGGHDQSASLRAELARGARERRESRAADPPETTRDDHDGAGVLRGAEQGAAQDRHRGVVNRPVPAQHRPASEPDQAVRARDDHVHHPASRSLPCIGTACPDLNELRPGSGRAAPEAAPVVGAGRSRATRRTSPTTPARARPPRSRRVASTGRRPSASGGARCGVPARTARNRSVVGAVQGP